MSRRRAITELSDDRDRRFRQVRDLLIHARQRDRRKRREWSVIESHDPTQALRGGGGEDCQRQLIVVGGDPIHS